MKRHQSDNQYNDDQLKYLEEIAEHTRPKDGITIIVSGTDSKITTRFTQPIKLNPKKRYELALLNLETYYSFPNINEQNNKFTYKSSSDSKPIPEEIPTGSYEIRAISEFISRLTKGNVTIQANLNTLKCILHVTSPYEIDMSGEGSIASVLGFAATLYKAGTYTGEHGVNILRVNSILVHTDVITSTYRNGNMEPVIYSFFPNVSPGEKIVAVQENLIYAPITIDTIYRMTTWLTDQDNIKLDLRGETLTIRFHLREC